MVTDLETRLRAAIENYRTVIGTELRARALEAIIDLGYQITVSRLNSDKLESVVEAVIKAARQEDPCPAPSETPSDPSSTSQNAPDATSSTTSATSHAASHATSIRTRTMSQVTKTSQRRRAT